MSALILYEDEHLLVVNKPARWNTHAPGPYAGEGVYDWLRHREPRWASLAILHRLDKDTSGLLVFGKTPLANRSLTDQFTRRQVMKEYRLATRSVIGFEQRTVRSGLRRRGERYEATELRSGSEIAETRFEVVSTKEAVTELRALPITGRTHQIRVHAAWRGFPVLGDNLYGGAPAGRLWLHAERLRFRHPETGVEVEFRVPANFAADHRQELREAVIDPARTDAYRVAHGAEELPLGFGTQAEAPGPYLDRLGDYLLLSGARLPRAVEEGMAEPPADVGGQRAASGSWKGARSKGPPRPVSLNQASQGGRAVSGALDSAGRGVAAQCWRERLAPWLGPAIRGVYHRELRLDARGRTADLASPSLLFGEPAPEAFPVRENGVQFEIRFGEGCSVGLFLDQRDNRRRLLANHVAAGFPVFAGGAATASVLNVFAYTCGFSVCAALAGASTTSLDLSRKYLDWGRRNFALNGLDPAAHDFIYGDAFDWMRRLAKQGRSFDAVLLDPPTFSTSKQHGVFRADADYAELVRSAAPLLKPGGVLFCSTNVAAWTPGSFLEVVHEAVAARGRGVIQEHYAPQPPDFPVSRAEPAYLKTVWLRLGVKP